MSEVTNWIAEAGEQLHRSFAKCPDELARDVVEKARAAFVKGNPRVWWLGLSRPFTTVDSSSRAVQDVLPASPERLWLIAEDDSNDLPVYEVTAEEVELIRKNCPAFEYYVLDKGLNWLVIENDHDEFIVCSRRV
jgi:hypothetical protein